MYRQCPKSCACACACSSTTADGPCKYSRSRTGTDRNRNRDHTRVVGRSVLCIVFGIGILVSLVLETLFSTTSTTSTIFVSAAIYIPTNYSQALWDRNSSVNNNDRTTTTNYTDTGSNYNTTSISNNNNNNKNSTSTKNRGTNTNTNTTNNDDEQQQQQQQQQKYINVTAFNMSLGLFGRYMMDGTTYVGRLQYLIDDDPYLCKIDPKQTSFQPSIYMNVTKQATSTSTSTSTSDNITQPSDDDSSTSSTTTYNNTASDIIATDTIVMTIQLPIVLLVARGQCPFYVKAANAESIDNSIVFLIVYNNPGDESLVPLYAASYKSNLVLLSVSYSTGQELIKYIEQQQLVDPLIRYDGGPIIQLDNIVDNNNNQGMMGDKSGTTDDNGRFFSHSNIQQTFISAIGLFLFVVSAASIVVLIVTMLRQHRLDRIRTQTGTTTAAVATDLTNGSLRMGRQPKLVSIEDVQLLQKHQVQYLHKQHSTSSFTTTNNVNNNNNKTLAPVPGAAADDDDTNHNVDDAIAATTATDDDDETKHIVPFNISFRCMHKQRLSMKLQNDDNNANIIDHDNSKGPILDDKENINDDMDHDDDDDDDEMTSVKGNLCSICLEDLTDADPNSMLFLPCGLVRRQQEQQEQQSQSIKTSDTTQDKVDTDQSSIEEEEEEDEEKNQNRKETDGSKIDNDDLIDCDCTLLASDDEHNHYDYHKFHYNCIMPWLTERQAYCPLCKFDVSEYVSMLKEKESMMTMTTMTTTTNDGMVNDSAVSSQQVSSTTDGTSQQQVEQGRTRRQRRRFFDFTALTTSSRRHHHRQRQLPSNDDIESQQQQQPSESRTRMTI